MTFVLSDPAHEAEKSLLLECLDGDEAIAGPDVLVEADDQGFGSSLFDVRAMWRHELRDVGTGLSARLANSNSDSRFDADGTPLGRDSTPVGANYSARLGRNLSLYGDYSMDVSKESGAQHNLLAGFRYLW